MYVGDCFSGYFKGPHDVFAARRDPFFLIAPEKSSKALSDILFSIAQWRDALVRNEMKNELKDPLLKIKVRLRLLDFFKWRQNLKWIH